ncbi:MAG: ATP phosphoribosyltransferase [Clostridia bacterium]|nr:ATP phosphoribosyltransferase [Clostridia bacterium]MBQ7122562.1 ATP phosphoribosyltransferase [Clostridia bacterium]
MLNIALPKGRLGDKVYELFASIGYDCSEIYSDNRKLVFENKENGVRYLLVKPSDVAIYIAHGAADIGVVGKDILEEGDFDIYELLDLGLGKCNMCVAAPNDYVEDFDRPLRVATKFVNIAKNYYISINREIEIIKLNGSIEIAPLLGLTDVIVDIVESGKTLKENNLRVYEQIMPISARLIANKSSYKFKGEDIDRLMEKLTKELAK